MNVISRFLTDEEATYYLMNVPKEYESFPSLAEVEKDCSKIYERKNFAKDSARKTATPDWVSNVAPGTPPAFEAIFTMIANSKSNTSTFNYAVRCSGLSEGQIWTAYDLWCKGEVSELIKNREVVLAGKTFR